MSIHPIDFRYGSKEIKEIFEERKKLDYLLKVEAALAEALADFDKIPREAANEIKNKATLEFVKLERMKEIEKETRHDIMALAGKYVHLTATSYDIVDTALALQLRDGLDILIEKGKELLNHCLDFAQEHKGLVMMGRTHGQHAIPTTLGFKFANYSHNIAQCLERLEEDKKYAVGRFAGAVGNYSAQQLYDLSEDFEKKIMEKLGIEPVKISTQVVGRENLARIISDIAIFAGSIEQMAKEIRNLQRTEIGELSEPFGKKQVGSSTMAQKKNPVNTENICSNVRIIRSCVYPALENIALEHERDITNSAAERSIIPTTFILMDEVLERMNKVMKGLVVFPENMKRNLEMTKGTIMSESVITELVKKGIGRQEAHEILRICSHKALAENIHLKQVLLENEIVSKYFDNQEMDKIMDHQNYIGLSIEKTEKIIKEYRN